MLNRLKSLIAAGAVAVAGLASPALSADAVIGISIPAATHGWTGGLNYHTKRTIDRMKEAFPNIDFVLATSSSATQQVDDIEDLMARNINALVVLPFESDPLTEPVKAAKAKGVFIATVDRGLAEEGIEDAVFAAP